LVAVTVLLGVWTAIAGPWGVTAAMGLLVAYLLLDIAHERRAEAKRNRP
jgi:hypothetical protein